MRLAIKIMMYYKYKKRKKSRRRRKEDEELLKYLPAAIVFIIVLVAVFTFNFLTNCIFEWPIRWDIGVCWDEQKEPSVRKATEEAIKFVP
jgi:hypothetical protein